MPSAAGSRRIVDTRYRPRSGPLPVETFRLSELRNRVDLGRVGAERPLFHLVIVGLDGLGEHEVDFDRVPIGPRHVLHVLPGQVHRWLRPESYEAQLVLLPDDADLSPAEAATGVHRWRLSEEAWARCSALLPLLEEEMRHEQPVERRTRALLAWRALLVQRLGLGSAGAAQRGTDSHVLPPPYLALRAELEAHLAPVRSVTQIAAALGYSARTLTRACQEATGRTAKQIVDERVFLEARRMLVHTDRSVAGIAGDLGFSEPTNFTKFFVRMSGRTPGRWRASQG